MSRSTTIITPPTQTALTTAEAVKAELGSQPASALMRLPGLLEQASSLIVGYIGREIARATVKDSFYGHHFRRASLVLSRLPVVTVTSVTAEGAAQDMSTIDLDAHAGVLHAHGRTIEVTYTGGYLLPGQVGRDLPYSIERACIDTVLALWHRSGRGDPMIRSESVDGIGSTQYLDPASGSAAAMPPTATAALDPFCHYAV